MQAVLIKLYIIGKLQMQIRSKSNHSKERHDNVMTLYSLLCWLIYQSIYASISLASAINEHFFDAFIWMIRANTFRSLIAVINRENDNVTVLNTKKINSSVAIK